MLKIVGLNKTYPNGVKAIDGIDLEIGKGMFGLLGPNGAGKSSLMRTIATLQEPDAGSITFDGYDVFTEKSKMRSQLGYLPQEFGVYPNSSAEDLLNHLAVLKGVVDRRTRKDTVDRLLEMTNLARHRKKNLGGFSGGMKQRFGIAQALIGNPKLIIVDEPTAGLDPEERDRFHNLLSRVGESVSIILSTHIVSDVSDLCQNMAIINNGRVLLQSSPQDALHSLVGKVWKRILPRTEAEALAPQFKVISSRLTHGQTMIRSFGDTAPDTNFESVVPDLEDVYFANIRGFLS